LLRLIAPFGGKDPHLARDQAGQCRGYGFASMPACGLEEAQSRQIELEGRPVYFGEAQKKEDRAKMLQESFQKMRFERLKQTEGQNLIVRNLPFDCEDEALREAFRPFGVVTSLKIANNANGRSLGFGHCAFSTKEEAQRAIEGMNGKEIMGRILTVAVHVPKTSR